LDCGGYSDICNRYAIIILMRLLKIVFIFILVMTGLYILACFFIPSTYKVERTEIINAPVDVVFEQMASFKNWDAWNPWKAKDPDLKIITSPHSKKGAYWVWKGTLAGEAKMTLTDIVENQLLTYHIAHLKPKTYETDGTITLENDANKTKVTWVEEGKNPFHLRYLNLLANKKTGPDLEKGLVLLKQVSELESNILQKEYYGYRIKETIYGGNKIGYIKKSILIKDMDAFFAKSYPKITQEAKNCGFKMDGAPMGLFYKWDYVNGVATVAAALPIMGDSVLGNDCSLMQLNKQKALVINYYGGYKSMTNVYTALDNYVRNKKHRFKGPVIEEYITGPKQQRDSMKWNTRVWYLIE